MLVSLIEVELCFDCAFKCCEGVEHVIEALECFIHDIFGVFLRFIETGVECEIEFGELISDESISFLCAIIAEVHAGVDLLGLFEDV